MWAEEAESGYLCLLYARHCTLIISFNSQYFLSTYQVSQAPNLFKFWKWKCSRSVVSSSFQPHGPARSLPGSSIHGIFQARILYWVAISSSRASSEPRYRTGVSHIAGRFFTIWISNSINIIPIFQMSKIRFWKALLKIASWWMNGSGLEPRESEPRL